MTQDGILFLSVLGLMVVGFLTERISRDVVAGLGLITLVSVGILTPNQAFMGFSSPVTITLVCVFFISAAIHESGVAYALAETLHRWCGENEVKAAAGVFVVGAAFSSCMNNVAATTLLIPMVISLATRGGLSVSRLLLPLAWGTVFGGMTTLIGSPPNLLAAQVLQVRGFGEFHFFDFFVPGIGCVIAGGFFIVFFAREYLPHTKPPQKKISGVAISQWYRLFERIFVCRIPLHSALDGMRLEHIELGRRLGCQVISVQRGSQIITSPQAYEIVHAGDILVLGGRLSEMHLVQLFERVSVERNVPFSLQGQYEGCRFIVDHHEWIGKTISQLRLHQQVGLLIVGIERDGDLLSLNLNEIVLQEGDHVRALAPLGIIDRLVQSGQFKSIERGIEFPELTRENVLHIRVRNNIERSDLTLRQLRVGEILGVTIIGIIRQGELQLVPDPDSFISSDDTLLALGNEEQLRFITALSELEVLSEQDAEKFISPALTNAGTRVVETILTPRSSLIGSNLSESKFRERFGFQVLALWREGTPIRAHLSRMTLRFGDVLLLQGPASRMAGIAQDNDLAVLTESQEEPRWSAQAWIVGLSIALLVLLPAFRITPPEVAAFIAALVVILGRIIRVEQAYNSIDWRIVVLVALLLPLGVAVESTGVAQAIGTAMMHQFGSSSPLVSMLALMVASSIISQALDGSLAVIIIGPLAVSSAQSLSVSPYPFVMGVALAASIAFLTPVSHKAALLVTNLGEYRLRHFMTLGGILTLISFVVVVCGTLISFPL